MNLDKTHYPADRNVLLGRRYAEVEATLGADVAFDLQGLLVDRFGANPRNKLVHGQLDRGRFDSPPSCYLWWLTLRLCCWPIVVAMQESAVTESEGEQNGEAESQDG